MTRRLVIAGALFAALALAAVWLARSEAALGFVVRRIAAASAGRVQIEGASGSLLGPLRAERVSVRGEASRVIAEDVTLAPRWRALAGGVLAAELVSVRSLRIEREAASGEPAAPPGSLALPIALELARVEIARVDVTGRGEPQSFADVRGAVRLGRARHALALEHLASQWGELSGSVELGARAPFPLEADLALARREAPAVSASVTARGTLLAPELELSGDGSGARLAGAAGLAPFEAAPVRRFALRVDALDLASLWPSAPRTEATFEATGEQAATGELSGVIRFENAATGPLSKHVLPLRSLAAKLSWREGALSFPELALDLGPAGAAAGDGRVADGALRLALAAERLDLHALHETLRATRLAGRLDAALAPRSQRVAVELRERGRELRGVLSREGKAVRADVVVLRLGRGTLAGAGEWDGARAFQAQARFRAFDPAALGELPSASLSGTIAAEGELGSPWRARLEFTLDGSRYRGRRLDGRGALTLGAEGFSHADARLAIGPNRFALRGGFGQPSESLALTLRAPDLGALGDDFRGEIDATARLTGTRARPGGEVALRARDLALPGALSLGSLDASAALSADGRRALRIALRADRLAAEGVAIERAELDAAGTPTDHAIALLARGPEGEVSAHLAGGWSEGWRGRLDALETRGRLALSLIEPAPLRWAPGRLAFGPARMSALGGEVALAELSLARGRWSSAGAASELSLAALLSAVHRDPTPAGDLRLQGVWVIPADPTQLGQIRIEHASGDAVLGGTALGITSLVADAALGARVARVYGRLAGERLGEAAFDATLEAAPGSALLARTAKLEGTLDANLASLRAAGGLVGVSARVDGTAKLALSATGNVGSPRVTGSLEGDRLRFDWPAAGVSLRDGALRARLAPDVLHVDALSFAAAKGALRASGAIPLDGAPARLAWEADHLRVLDRPDRNLEVSGAGEAGIAQGRLALRGRLRANRGYIELPRAQQARLGDDVIVLGRAPKASGAGAARRLDLDLELDAGKRLHVVGGGLDAQLRGKLRVRSLPDGTLVAYGKIDASRGTYRAFGQQLEIERGALLFDGPLNDPALDVLALRKNLAVEAGVELSGTLSVPLARLTSDPPVPDSEKLSWLVLGHGISDASASDTGLLQAAAATLLRGDEAVPIGQRIARGVGLDEIALRQTGDGTTEATGRAVALGKRLTDALYLEYEYGLEAASHLVRLHYALTRSLSLRAETSGVTSNVGVNFRKSWD